MYVGLKYERSIPTDIAWRITRVRLFEVGHSFEDIDNMSLEDIGDVLGYWQERSRAEAALQGERQRLGSNSRKGR